MSTQVLGLDPGFAATGYAVVDIVAGKDACSLVIKAAGVIRTSKAPKRRRVYAADDNLYRVDQIGSALDALIRTWRIQAICAEAMSFPRSASVAAKIALCWGAVATIARHARLPIVQVTPQALKIAVCGQGNASKDDIKEVVVKKVPQLTQYLPRAHTMHEHVVDSCGAVLACLDSDVVRALLRAKGK